MKEMADPFFLVIAVSTFVLGAVLFIVSVSSTSWQGLNESVTVSIWNNCFLVNYAKMWVCNFWHDVPDFVRSSQAFVIIALLCYAVSCFLLIAAFVLRCLHRSKVTLIVLSLLTFTSACMIAMMVIVMAMKGRDYLLEMKQGEDKIYKYHLQGKHISGHYEIGWAMIVAIVASLINFISFAFFLLEYKDITDIHKPAAV